MSCNHSLQSGRLVGRTIITFPPNTAEERQDNVSNFHLFAQHIANIRCIPRNGFQNWIRTFYTPQRIWGLRLASAPKAQARHGVCWASTVVLVIEMRRSMTRSTLPSPNASAQGKLQPSELLSSQAVRIQIVVHCYKIAARYGPSWTPRPQSSVPVNPEAPSVVGDVDDLEVHLCQLASGSRSL